MNRQKPKLMRSRLPDEITSMDEVQQFFEELAKHGELFHIEDDPYDIYITQTDERMFTDEEAAHINSLINQSYAHVEDPCEFAYNAFIKYMENS